MQCAIKAAIQYIDASLQAGTQAPTMISITKDRVDNLKLMLGRMPNDLQDMTNAISTLASTTAFSPEQRSSLVQSIHAKMQDNGGHARDGDVATKTQTHKFVEHYITAELWDKLHDKSLPEEARVKHFIDFLHHRNGCKFPDVQSRKRFVSIILLANGSTPTPRGAKACFDLFAQMNVKMRSIRTHIPCTLNNFPQDPNDFMMLHPALYDADGPPTTSRFSGARIDEVATIVSARGTNKLLAEPSGIRTVSLPACTNVDAPMRQMMELSANPMMMNMMRALANMANGVQTPGRDMTPPLNIDFRRESQISRSSSSASVGEQSLFRAEHKALADVDGTLPPPSHEITGAVPAASHIEDDIDDMIGVGIKAKSKSPHGETQDDADKKNDGDKKDDADGRGRKRANATNASDNGHVDNLPKKRANTTKDYGTNLKTPPKLAGLVLPCLFNNCKIYGTDKKFRVYPRPNESKYDRGFAFTPATKAKVWAKVIEYCKKPVIPTTSPNFIK